MQLSRYFRYSTQFVCLLALSIIGLTGCNSYPSATFSGLDSEHEYTGNYRFPSKREATGNNVFVFDPKHTSYALYNKSGYLIRQGRASGGQFFCADTGRACTTPAGEYRIYREGDSECKSSKFPLGKGGAPMPHCLFFKGGYAIHGSYDVPNHNASHGCIRVPPGDAAWLAQHHLSVGDTVIVHSYYE